MRSLLGVVMTVVMAVTSLSAAHARGQSSPVGTMVICRGLTVATVLIGADGQPVEVQHICPDAALALFVESGAVPPPTVQAVIWQAVQWDAPALVAGSLVAMAAQARGPPAFL
ncbi:hypothetical protein [Antarctobacter sp.]|uniref:hypothetical protein n=1 Tax=Antarctobacter sp. TaxID=1872577 RepID=UPI002B269090|nr:hypothetical protein [Antarctobacter sp.]